MRKATTARENVCCEKTLLQTISKNCQVSKLKLGKQDPRFKMFPDCFHYHFPLLPTRRILHIICYKSRRFPGISPQHVEQSPNLILDNSEIAIKLLSHIYLFSVAQASLAFLSFLPSTHSTLLARTPSALSHPLRKDAILKQISQQGFSASQMETRSPKVM